MEGIVSQQTVFDARREVLAVKVAEPIEQYIVALISATRNPDRYGGDLKRWIHVGASPRGTLALDRASRANAWLQGRHHVLPRFLSGDDIRNMDWRLTARVRKPPCAFTPKSGTGHVCLSWTSAAACSSEPAAP